MTLEEAIRHEEEMAECGAGSTRRADKHRAIAAWLRNYKSILELLNCNDCADEMSCTHVVLGQLTYINCPLRRAKE